MFRLLDLVAGGIVKNAVTVDIQDAVTEVLGGTGSGVLLVCIVKGGGVLLLVLGLDVEVVSCPIRCLCTWKGPSLRQVR